MVDNNICMFYSVDSVSEIFCLASQILIGAIGVLVGYAITATGALKNEIYSEDILLLV